MRSIKRHNQRKGSNPLRFTPNGVVHPRYSRYGVNLLSVRRVLHKTLKHV